MYKISKLRFKGSYTVEVSLIFPLVIFIIIGLIYLGFYLHDYGRVQALVYESQIGSKALVRSEVNINSGIQSYEKYLERSISYPIDNDFGDKEKEIKDFIESKSENLLFISQIKGVKVGVNALTVKIEIELKFNFPFKIIQDFFIEDEKILISNETIHNPMEFIRGYEAAKRLAN